MIVRMKENHIDREGLLNTGWTIEKTSTEETGLRLFTVKHPNSNLIPTEVTLVEANDKIDVASTTAWAGGTLSRKNIPIIDAYRSLNDSYKQGKDEASQKMVKFGEGYGHASLFDMADVFIYMHKIPMHLAYELFYQNSVYAGQESSSRYIVFDDLGIDPLEILLPIHEIKDKDVREELNVRWEALQMRMRDLYFEWTDLVREAYSQKFGNDLKESTLDSRTLDIARLWIPLGTKTSVAMNMAARGWIDNIQKFSESTDIRNLSLAKQLLQAMKISETEVGHDASFRLGSLLRHYHPTNTIPNNLDRLKEFIHSDKRLLKSIEQYRYSSIGGENGDNILQPTRINKIYLTEGEGIGLQYLINIFPGLNESVALAFLNSSHKLQEKIGEIIFAEHTHHNQLRNMGDIRGPAIYSISSAIAYHRDLNRHRAWGRFTPFFSMKDPNAILYEGFNRNIQIFGTKGFEHLQQRWAESAQALYAGIWDLKSLVDQHFPYNDGSWLKRILPLGHNIKVHMSAPITQQHYMPTLRERRGGDYGYVEIAQGILEANRTTDPLLKHMMPNSTPLDLDSEEEFKVRS